MSIDILLKTGGNANEEQQESIYEAGSILLALNMIESGLYTVDKVLDILDNQEYELRVNFSPKDGLEVTANFDVENGYEIKMTDEGVTVKGLV